MSWKGSAMTETKEISKYLPLSETTCYTMLCLAEEPLHGYALMQKVSEISQGTVSLGAGTLYTIFSTLEKEALIEMVSETDRRKVYALTPKGKQVLALQIQRLEIMLINSQKITHRL
jgi:DNA-binding PadR family transcriptional regulator